METLSHRATGRLLVTLDIVLRVLCAAGLAVDGVIHLLFAGDYDRIGTQITEGTLFRIEAIVAILAAIAIAATSRRVASAFAFLVALSAFVAVYGSVHWHIGAIGPFPDVYEPIWFAQKRAAAVTEAVSAVAAAVLLVKGRARWRIPSGFRRTGNTARMTRHGR